jgi:fibronectin-binding autotransporter adhesin
MRKHHKSIVLAAFGVILSASGRADAQVTYNGPGNDWTVGANWSIGTVPATSTGPVVGTLSRRLNVASSVTGVSLTYTASLGTLTLGTSSPAGDTRAFQVGTATGGSVFNIEGGLVRATPGAVGPTGFSIIGQAASGSNSVLNVSGGVLDLTTTSNFDGQLLSIGFSNPPSTGVSSTLNISGTGSVRATRILFNGNNGSTGGLTAGVTIGSGGSLSTNQIIVGTGDAAQTGTSSTVTFNGGTLIATGTAGRISSNISSLVTTGGAIFQVDSDTFTVNKLMTGPGGLTKNGNGTLSLVSQTYTGATTINAGILRFGTSSSFTASTVIGGAGAMEKTGTATSALTINLANTYDGPTTINSGAIVLSGSGALGSTNGATTVASPATLGLGGNVTIPAGETITIAGTGVASTNVFFTGSAVQRGALQGVSGTNNLVQGNVIIGTTTGTRIGVQDGASLTISGNITQAATGTTLTFRSGGTGVVLLSGSNNWSGSTAVFGSTLRLGSNTGLPAASLLSVGTASIGQSIVDLNGFSPTVAGLVVGGGANADAIIRNDGATDSILTINPASPQSFAGVILDGATNKISLVKTGGSTQSLSGTSTYTGSTTVSGGQLNANGSLTSSISVGGAGTLGGEGTTTGAVTFAAGSSFSFNPTTGTFFTAAGTVDTTAGATTKINIRVSAPATSGTGIVVLQGGTLTSNGPSDFNLLSRGSLSVVGNQLLYDYVAGSIVWKGANATNPTFWDVNTTTQNFTLGGVDDVFFVGDNVLFDDTASNFTPAAQAPLTAGTLNFNNTANAYTVTGSAVTSSSLTKAGTNSAILANNHTVNGNVAVNAGTLQLGNGGTTGTLVSTGGLTIGAASTLAIDFGSNAGTVSFVGGITGDGSIVKNGSGRTQITTASVANTGPTTINDGTLAINFRTAGVVQTYGGEIGGNGNFEKSGSGVLTLDRANTYAGLTSVTGGYLRILNAASLASTSGVVVTAASSLALTDGIVVNKSITLSGTGATVTASGVGLPFVQRGALQGSTGASEWQGTVTIAASDTRIGIQDGATLTVSGKITDGANDFRVLFRTAATGSLILTNPNNDWSGGTDVLGMGVKLGVNNGISPLGDLRIGTGFIGASVLDLNGFSQSATALWEFGGEPTNGVTNTAGGLSVLTITDGARPAFASGSSSYSSSISGNIALVKTGSGTQSFTGSATLTYTGDTTVSGGLLDVNTPLRPVTGSLVVTGPGAATLAAAPTPLAGSGYTVAAEVAGITVTSGGLVTVTPVDRALNKASVVVTGGLSISGGVVNVGTSDLIIKGGAASLSTLRSYAATYLTTSGATGLGSSVATPLVAPYTTIGIIANSQSGLPLFSSFDGVSVDTNDAIVKYTYVGDVDLNGLLDATDFNAVLNGLTNNLTGWDNGDVNYDGVVNGSDWSLFLTAYTWYGTSGTPLSGGGEGGGSIPEPTSLGLLAVIAPLMGRRRR